MRKGENLANLLWFYNEKNSFKRKIIKTGKNNLIKRGKQEK